MAKSITKMQLQHLERSLSTSIKEKMAEFCSNLPKVNILDEDEKLAIIRMGEADKYFELPSNVSLYTRLTECYKFPGDAANEGRNKIIEKETKRLNAVKANILESAVFMGMDEVYTALQNFKTHG